MTGAAAVAGTGGHGADDLFHFITEPSYRSIGLDQICYTAGPATVAAYGRGTAPDVLRLCLVLC